MKVKGYSLDAQVKFIRLLGVSPETGEEDIKRTFLEVGIGEIVEIKKGLLDVGRLPGVTNGTWILRVKILDPDKIIPSYIHRRDEGELWSLNFEGRVFCCWKCGSGNHIGDKCRDQTRTFDEIFQGGNDNGDTVAGPTWAAVVRSGQADNEEQRNRVKEMERRLKEVNLRKDNELKDLEEKRKEMEEKRKEAEDEDERQKQRDVADRQKALAEVTAQAQQFRKDAEVSAKHSNVQEGEVMDDSDLLNTVEECTDSDLLQAAGFSVNGVGNVSAVLQVQVHDSVAKVGDRARLTALQHLAWLDQRSAAVLVGDHIRFSFHPDLEMIFGDGATRLAIEFDNNDSNVEPVSIEGEVSENSLNEEESVDWSQEVEADCVDKPAGDVVEPVASSAIEGVLKLSSPKAKRKKKRRRGKSGSFSSSDSDLKSEGVEGSSLILGSVGNENKKPRVEDQGVMVLGGGQHDSLGSAYQPVEDFLPGDNLVTDLSVNEGDDSSHEDEMSSGVTLDTIQPESSGMDGMGGV